MKAQGEKSFKTKGMVNNIKCSESYKDQKQDELVESGYLEVIIKICMTIGFHRVLGQKPEFNWVEKGMGGTLQELLL